MDGLLYELKSTYGYDSDYQLSTNVNCAADVRMVTSSMTSAIQTRTSHCEQEELGLSIKQAKRSGRSGYVSFSVMDGIQSEQKNVSRSRRLLEQHTHTLKTIHSAILRQLDHDTRAKVLFLLECKRYLDALPIYSSRLSPICILDKQSVLIIQSQTGTGKSTQIPQYLMHEHLEGRVVCTQPRKIAARALAKRVDSDMPRQTYLYRTTCSFKLDGEMDYDVGILYTTDKALLDKYAQDKTLSEYSVIVVDEVHVRSLYTDLLLSVLKKLVATRLDLKIVVMSATIDLELFTAYFNGCPSIRVPGAVFDVEVIWADKKTEHYVDAAVETVARILDSGARGHILVFLCNQQEIDQAIRGIGSFRDTVLFPLHGQLLSDDQEAVFEPVSDGVRKVIVSTNVAETSITIPGVTYVVDSGMARTPFYNPSKRLTTISTVPITKSSADQRMGRAGRTESGTCYRLYTQKDYDDMASNSTPEIHSIDMGIGLLKLLVMGIDIAGFEFIEPPKEGAVDSALLSLWYLGAIDKENKLTTDGQTMARLQLEPRLSRMILEGSKRGCLYEAMAVAALISVGGNVMYRGISDAERVKCDRVRVERCDPLGDIVAILKIFYEWMSVPGGKDGKRAWCLENAINAKTMRTANDTLNELIQLYRVKKAAKMELTPRLLLLACKCFFLGFFQNSACYNGENISGYTLGDANEYPAYIHPSSFTTCLDSTPQYLVCAELRQTTGLYMVNVSWVDGRWFEEIPPGAVSLSKMTGGLVKRTHTVAMNPLVVKRVAGTYKATMSMRDEVNVLCNYNYMKPVAACVLGGSKVCNGLSITVRENDTSRTQKLVNAKVVSVVKELHDNVVYRSLTGGYGTVVIKQGCVVSCIVNAPRSKTLQVVVDGIVASDDDIKARLQLLGNVYSTVKYDFPFCDWQNLVWGEVVFENNIEALRALEVDEDENFYLRPVDERLCQRLKIQWFPLDSTGRAYITFDSVAETVAALAILCGAVVATSEDHTGSLRAYMTCYERHRKNDTTIIAHIPDDVDGIQLREYVASLAITSSCQVHVSRHRFVGDRDEFFQKQQTVLESVLDKTLKRIDSTNEYKVVHLVKNVTAPFAIVQFGSTRDSEWVSMCLHKQPNIMGTGIVYANYSSRFVHHVPKRRSELPDCMQVLSGAIKRVNRNGDIHAVFRTEKDGHVVIIVDGNDGHSVNAAFGTIAQALRGTQYLEFSDTIEMLNSPEAIRIMKQIEESTKTWIQVDSANDVIYIHGAVDDKAISLLRDALKDIEIVSIPLTTIAGQGIGVMRTLFVKYGRDLERLCSQCALGPEQVYVDTKKRVIVVQASEAKVQAVRDCIRSLVATTYDKVEGSDVPECPICLSSIDGDAHVLIGCGHQFCKHCLVQQSTLSAKNGIFPITCALDGCNSPLSMSDLNTINTKKSFDKVMDLSVAAYVRENVNDYRFCPTSGCGSVYCVTTKAAVFQCRACWNTTCTSCHLQGHTGFSCAELQETCAFIDEWKTTGEGSSKNCPYCNILIEKNGGCQHVICFNCKRHICWICSTCFRTQVLYTRHCMSVHLDLYV